MSLKSKNLVRAPLSLLATSPQRPQLSARGPQAIDWTMDSGLGTGMHSNLRKSLTRLSTLVDRSDIKENFLTCLNIRCELVKLKISLV